MVPILSAHRRIAVLLASSLFLAACSDKPPAPTATVGGSATHAEMHKPATPNTSTELNEALNPKDVKFSLSLIGHPKYIEDQDTLLFNIQVANHGGVALVGVGTKPVNLGALLLGPDGPDKPPGLREFVRVHLPLIASGDKKALQVMLPAESLKGQTLQFQLVQEGVMWFDGAGQSPLTLGAYSRCNSQAKTLCDAAGTPVAH